MRGSDYALLYDKTMEAEQGFNILFTRLGKLRATQTSTTAANVKQAPLERDLIKLMDDRQSLIREGQLKGFDNVSELKGLTQEEQIKSISKLLKENKIELDRINEKMSEIGVRTLVRVNLLLF